MMSAEEAMELALVRTTITIDETVAVKVRQMFSGNLSKGVNALLFEHLFREKKRSLFGILEGKNYLKDLEALEKEERY